MVTEFKPNIICFIDSDVFRSGMYEDFGEGIRHFRCIVNGQALPPKEFSYFILLHYFILFSTLSVGGVSETSGSSHVCHSPQKKNVSEFDLGRIQDVAKNGEILDASTTRLHKESASK